MLTYQLRKRVFRVENGQTLSFPNSAELLIVLQPLQLFGVEAAGGRTAVRAVEATVQFNANTGEHFIESGRPLEPLEVTIEEPGRRWDLQGNVLRVIIDRCESNQVLTELIESLYYGLPILLNIELADPPVVERIAGKVGSTWFRWELVDWQMTFQTTEQEVQERKVAESWQRLGLLTRENRRLTAGLHYFHMACRLVGAGHSPWEFMAESMLNLSKVLEVLFPPSGDGMTRDAVRMGLRGLGYSDLEVERDFLPAIALRNEIDVGHVDLSLFTRRQLHALHRYAEAAENAFREMLQLLMRRMADGQFVLSPYMATSAGTEAQHVIERIERYFGQDT